MAISSGDQRELILPLIEGIHEDPPFGDFLRRLVARTYARRAMLTIAPAGDAPTNDLTVLHEVAPRAAGEPTIDRERLAALGLHPRGPLRPGRVYALDEMLDHDDPARLAVQREAMADMGIRHGRWLRVSARGTADAWLVLVREREDFSAAAVAVLGGIGDHLAAALRALAALSGQRLAASLAQSALERLGAGQLALDAGGRILAADPWAEAHLAFMREPGADGARRRQLPPDAARAVAAACAELSAGPAGATRLLAVDPRGGLDLLLRKADLPLVAPSLVPAVIGTIRLARREDARQAALVLAAAHGLSAREAALAVALSRGETLTEAGESLRLTPETARNYSKRIYAKTGTRGQADLVRLILTGLAPFA